ncbi:hypothetical protein CK203_044372 [Vitis vinifera]|uniref:Uncharacterized protein n=1 Tax=Vitis vinifera TaxID=29760 RepID=A0A438H819_VITVI|nr:hypothetical protein CK203_044372 [Vitis vinifera]
MDAVLQIFKRSICPGTPFFESLAKSLLQRWTICSDVLTNIQCSKMTYVQPLSKFWLPDGLLEIADRHAKPPDRPKPVDRRQDGPSRPDRPPITPLSVSYEKLLPMIQGLSDFRWPRPLETDPSIRDRSKKCAFHKDHGHTTETCRSLQYLVERLIKAGHLKQYLRSDTGGRDASQHHNSGAPRAPVAPKAVINYINGGPSDEEYDSRRKRQKLLRAASIRERINSIRPGSSADLVQASVIGHMGHSLAGLENPGRILSGFNGSSTTSLGDIILPVQAGPVTLNVQFSWYKSYHPSMSSWDAHGFTT